MRRQDRRHFDRLCRHHPRRVALPQLGWDVNITSHLLVVDVVSNPIKVVDGHVAAPDGPGLGVAVDGDKLARYRRG